MQNCSTSQAVWSLSEGHSQVSGFALLAFSACFLPPIQPACWAFLSNLPAQSFLSLNLLFPCAKRLSLPCFAQQTLADPFHLGPPELSQTPLGSINHLSLCSLAMACLCDEFAYPNCHFSYSFLISLALPSLNSSP